MNGDTAHRKLRAWHAGLFLACLSLSGVVHAELTQCRAIDNDPERLACYDTQAGRPAQSPPETALQQRERSERALQSEQFALTPYRTNYFLPVTYLANADFKPYRAIGAEDGDLKHFEAKYQFSVRTLIWPDMFGSQLDAWVAFTIQSWWQVYAPGFSSPFRETNYEPELFVAQPLHWKAFGWNLHQLDLGLDHQSNGRGGELSRSWNRTIFQLVADKGESAFYVRGWYRIPESDDDNPGIERYMGQIELGLGHRWSRQTLAITLKNNLRADNRSGLQLDWSFPLAGHLKGYCQLYSGYGENLVDGPNSQTRLGLGLMLTDWL